jgi:cell wall-associated NlpC family hydrolase
VTGGATAVPRLSSRRPVRLRLLAVTAVAGVLLAGSPWHAVPAHADPSVASAQAKAAELAKQVKALQVQVEVATEQYDAVQEQLGEVVSRYLTATQDAGELQQQTDLLQARRIARARALYMAGGQLGLYAQVLDGTDINDVISRITAVGHVLDAEQGAIDQADTAVTNAQVQAAHLDELAAQRTALQVQATQARARVLDLLAQTSGELDSANSLVRRLLVQQQEQAAALAAAQAARLLATAATPPITLPDGTAPQVVAAIDAARTRLGAPYVWGATGPDVFDCSGLTQWAYAAAGVNLPRTSREQWWVGPHPALDELQPGDLLFWATDTTNPATIHHVALYIGQGYMIEAPHTGAVVHVTPVYLDGYIGATRPVLTTG